LSHATSRIRFIAFLYSHPLIVMTRFIFVTTLLLLKLPFAYSQVSTYTKTFPPDEYENFTEIIPFNNGHIFITDKAFYKVDATGHLVTKKIIKEGISSYMESIIPDGNGNFWIVSHIFETIDLQKLTLYKVDNNGNILSSKDLEKNQSFERIRLKNGKGQNFYLTYKHRNTESGDAHLDVVLLNENANKIWHKELSQKIYNQYTIQAGNKGSLDVCYMTSENYKAWLLTVNDDADTKMTELQIDQPVDKFRVTYNFCKATDGGYMFVGTEVPANGSTNLVLYKTNTNGRLDWIKTMSIYLNDQSVGVIPNANGYVILLNTGNNGWGDNNGGDIVLLKTDLQGNQQWIKAFGSSKSDYGSQLLQNNDGSLIIGGKASYPGQVVPITTLCKTDAEGNIDYDTQISLEPASSMKIIETSSAANIQNLSKAALTNDGGFMLGSNFNEKTDLTPYPYLIKATPNGQVAFEKKLSPDPASIKTLIKTTDGQFLAVTEQKDIFASRCTAVKFTQNGDTLWTTVFGASNIKDVINTSDGGYLISGSLDISFVNFEVLLIKLDAGGKITWQKTIGERAQWETGRRIVETPDNGFLIVGNNQLEFDIVSDIHILKIDKNGNKLFSKNVKNGLTIDIANDIAATSNNNFIIVGTESKQPFDNKNIVLLKIDGLGNTIWRKTVDKHLQDEGLFILPAANDGFYISGTTAEPNVGKLEKFAYVSLINANGDITWTKYYGKEGLQTTAYCLMYNEDELVLFGNTQQEYAQEKIFFVNVNQTHTEEPVTPDTITLYPNPARGNGCNLLINNDFIGNVQVVVYDATGKKLAVSNFPKNQRKLLQKTSLLGYASGVYYYSISMGNSTVLKRLLLTR
jgi:archaellin